MIISNLERKKLQELCNLAKKYSETFGHDILIGTSGEGRYGHIFVSAQEEREFRWGKDEKIIEVARADDIGLAIDSGKDIAQGDYST